MIMKHPIIWVLPCLLSAIGCSPNQPVSSEPVLSQSSPSQGSQPTSPIDPSTAAHPASQTKVATSPASPTSSSPTSVSPKTTPPTPTTSNKVTIRADIRTLDRSRLIADCPSDSGPYAFAESAHYQIQICSQEYDPWLPKYYIGQSKADHSRLQITSTNLNEARQLIFKNAGYTYILYRDSARPEQSNAYLQVYSPNGDQYSEALLYLYEMRQPH